MNLVKIRPAAKEDVPSIIYLNQVFAEYQKQPNGPKLGQRELLRDLFGETKYAHAIVVELLSDPEEPKSVPSELPSSKMSRNKRIIGHVIYNYGYNMWDGRFLFIEDIFLKAEMRHKGIGTALFRECAKIAVAKECSRMVWQAFDWNADSIQFYEQRIGATLRKELLTYKLNREELTKLSQEPTD